MSPAAPAKPPKHFWIVVILAVIWNGYGVYDWFMSLRGAAYYQAAGLTPEQVAYQTALPVWMQMAWAIGVMMAALGTILLIARRRQAAPVFALSLVCAILSVVYQNVMSPGWKVMGDMIWVGWAIAAICAGLAGYAGWMTKKGVLV